MGWNEIQAILTGPLPVAGVLGLIVKVLWAKLEQRDKELDAKDLVIAQLQDARIADLKKMLRPDDSSD